MNAFRFGAICGRAEPVSSCGASSSGCGVELEKSTSRIESGIESAIGNGVVSAGISTSSNFDQSSLGSDDSGICCGGGGGSSSGGINPLRMTRSAECLDDNDDIIFDESKSLNSDNSDNCEMDHAPAPASAAHCGASTTSSSSGDADVPTAPPTTVAPSDDGAPPDPQRFEQSINNPSTTIHPRSIHDPSAIHQQSTISWTIKNRLR